MVSIENATIARISKGNLNFEILVDPNLALDFKKGKDIAIENVLAIQEVFKDSKKGERASKEELEKFFNTSDVFKIADYIINDGEIQLTIEQRRKFIEDKRLQIANLISKHGIDPKTKLPHPVQRILNAMEQAKVNIDAFKSANQQVGNILAKIQIIIPISLERVEIAIKIPIEYAGKANSIIREITPVKKEEWQSNAWYALLEIPAGMQSEIYEKLNKLTVGKAEIKIVKEHKI